MSSSAAFVYLSFFSSSSASDFHSAPASFPSSPKVAAGFSSLMRSRSPFMKCMYADMFFFTFGGASGSSSVFCFFGFFGSGHGYASMYFSYCTVSSTCASGSHVLSLGPSHPFHLT